MNRLLPCLLLLIALAAPAAASAGVPVIDYRVEIAGTADYNRADVDEEASAQHDETVDFRTIIPKLSFYGDAAEDSRGALGTATVRRGSYTITGPGGQVHCAGHQVTDVTAGGLDATRAPDRTTFAARVIDGVTVQVSDCSLAGMGAWNLPLGSGGEEVGVGVFDGAFTVPHNRIGEATMRFPLAGEVTGASCPLHHAKTVLCSLTWDAVVTFTRTGEHEEDIVVPDVPIVPAPAPQADPDDDLLVPLVAKAELAGSLRRASLPVRCVTACRGTLTATARGKRLARARFAVEAGGRARVTVRFGAADRRAIRRAGRVKLTVNATDGEDVVRRKVTLRT